MNKLLLIGGNGFLGKTFLNSSLCKDFEKITVLTSGDPQIAISKSNIHYENSRQFVENHDEKYDFIINMAQKRNAKTYEEAAHFNCEVPIKIIRKTAQAHSKVINFSSYIQNYEIAKSSRQYNYQQSKIDLAQRLHINSNQLGFRLVDISLFTLFGKYDAKESMLMQFLSQDTKLGPFKMSAGFQLVSWTDADDVVRAIGRLLDRSEIKGNFSLWPLPPISLRDFFDTLNQLLPKPASIEWGAYPYGGHELFEYDPKTFPIEFPDFNFTDMRETIQKLIPEKEDSKSPSN